MPNNVTATAERVGLLMEVHGDSYRKAAERCGLDHTTLVRIRQGESGNPATLERIAEGYGVPAKWLQGEPDLNTDFAMGLLVRPLQERIELIWDKELRLGYALTFLASYPPNPHSTAQLANLLQVPVSEVEGILQQRRGRIDGVVLELFCKATGLPYQWLCTGLIGREDEEKLLTGLAEWALTSLAARVGVHVEKDAFLRAVQAMV